MGTWPGFYAQCIFWEIVVEMENKEIEERGQRGDCSLGRCLQI